VTRRLPALLCLAGLLACTSSGPRPIAAVAEEVVDVSVRVAFTAALQAMTDQGLPLRNSDPDAGTLETEYVNMQTYRPETAQYPYAERLVRFRVQVTIDSDGAGARVAFFGIYSPFSTGLTNTRRNERAIPRDHPAAGVIRDMARKVREIVEGP